MNSPEKELWEIIMRLVEPADLLHTILNNGRKGQESGAAVEIAAARNQTLLLVGCTVTIDQHVDGTASRAPAGKGVTDAD